MDESIEREKDLKETVTHFKEIQQNIEKQILESKQENSNVLVSKTILVYVINQKNKRMIKNGFKRISIIS